MRFEPTREFYLNNQGAKVKLGTRQVVVGKFKTEFNWWAMLNWGDRFSMDHGQTWHRTRRDAYRVKGKMRLTEMNGARRK